MKKSYLIKGGKLIDPANKINIVTDILVSEGKVARIGKDINVKADETINAKGRLVTPGFVDMHTHLREPGREDKETILTGTRAAVHGGYTSIMCMPNTDPSIDNVQVVKNLKAIIAKDAICNVLICAAITEGREGKKFTDFAALKKEGAIAVSDDGSPTPAAMMPEALALSKKTGTLLVEHCEVPELSRGGVMNKGFVATKLGLKGIPASSEYEAVKYNIDIAEKTGARIHIAHVSCKESVDIIRKAKKRRIAVTAETAAHYFALTEACCASYDTNTKINPPLRTDEDVAAIKAGLTDGTIDAIATDHAPHTDSEKDVEFDYAPFGKIGLESTLSISVMELIDKKVLSWDDLVCKLSYNPAKILGLGSGSLGEGNPADITIIDPEKEYILSKDSIESKSKNSPFIGWKVKGKVTDVFVLGNLVMRNELIL